MKNGKNEWKTKEKWEKNKWAKYIEATHILKIKEEPWKNFHKKTKQNKKTKQIKTKRKKWKNEKC